jgi:apolipoprotein N-acyltransferase
VLALCARVEARFAPLCWVALVPWLLWLGRAERMRTVLLTSWFFGVAFTCAVFGWFARGIADYADAPVWQGWLALVLFAPALQPQFITHALARNWLARRGASGLLVALASSCVYVATEWALPKLFEDTLGHGLFPSRHLRQAADLAGAPGLTLAILLGNECVCAAQRRRSLRPLLGLALLVAALFAYGQLRVREVAARAAASPAVAAGLVQADISHYGRLRAELGTHDAVRAILDAHFALSSELLERGPLDLLLWPETVYPTTFGTPKSEAGAAFDREIGAFVAATGVPLVFGAYDAEGGREYNAAVFLTPTGGARVEFDTYRKAQLFPLTERVPALFASERVRRMLPWLGTWQPGPGAQVVELALRDGRTLRVAPLICYDAVSPNLAHDEVRRGAELFVTLSNDSWFATGGGPRLHLVVSAFRSIETRRPQLRVTNTGISAVIDATGELNATAGVHERAAISGRVHPERVATTLVLAFGNWLGPVSLAVAIAVFLALAFARGR